MKETDEIIQYHWDDNILAAKGTCRGPEKYMIGHWQWFYKNGALEQEGIFSENGDEQGLWIWNDINGNRKIETIYII